MPEGVVQGRLALESGAVFDGVLFGAALGDEGVSGEVVFNTCMTGYQEVASDPSYAGQMVVLHGRGHGVGPGARACNGGA